jgi:IS5 family transposase
MKQKRKYKQTTIKNMKFIDSDSLYNKFIDKNSVLVKIHDTINFSFVNDLCDEVYSDDGQNAFLPELVFRVSFIQYFKNGLSDNEVVRQCKTNFEYRYFCNLAIDDELFDDCKLSRFRKEIGVDRFKQIFDLLVQKIKDAGYISENDVQYLDSFLFLADVKIISINSLLSKSIQQVLKDLNKNDSDIENDGKKRDFELSEYEQKERFVFLVKKAQDILAFSKNKKDLSAQTNKSVSALARIVKERAEITKDEIRKKESGEEKDKIISASDNEARMMGKKEEDIKPRYKSHVAMTKNRFITYTDVTLATVYDGHHAVNSIADLKRRGFDVPMAVGDSHFGDISLRENMALQDTQIIAPYRKNQATNSCLTKDAMIEAWAYNHTQEYKEHIRIRAYIEPKQGELKNLHGMSRAKFRGLQKIRMQNYMSAIAVNCKKLATAS